MKRQINQFFCVTVLILAACGSSTEVNLASTDAGKDLFRQSVLGGAAGCATCHSLEPDTILIGPSLAGIGSLAEGRIEGLSAEEYLRQSITEPNSFLVSGFPEGVMPSTFSENLSNTELDSLVSYLLTLK